MKRSFILIGVILLAFTLSSRCLCIEIFKLREDLSKKFASFNSKVDDMTLEASGKVLQDNKEIATTKSKIFRKGTKLRIENSLKVALEDGKIEERSLIMVYDGKDAWMIDPLGNVMKIEDIPEAHIMDPTRLIPDDAVLKGEEEIDGRSCYLVSYPENSYRVWIDKKRLIPLKMETGEFVVLFKDYKQVVGIWGIPYTTIARGGGQEIVSCIKSLEVNPGLSNELFKVKVGKSK